ncbi:galactosyl transferase GMA12/MNN10 family-domain-containing protein, partial [Halteromyces radiatus]|uniref:galactosyl transferase GMA12/MNN10 family-domain-containing protein n=1 Tax=Halteromyces radiatus TaxID=101107 RepID=UPI00221EAF4E
MPADLPLYKSDSSTLLRRPKQNKRLIIAFALIGVCFIFYLNARLTASNSQTDQETLPTSNRPNYDSSEPTSQQQQQDDYFPSIVPQEEANTSDNKDTYSPSTHSDSHKPMTQPFDDETTMIDTVINTSKHYPQLVLITSNAVSMDRRRLIREKYFGLRDNLLPCMTYNADVYYKFLIHGGAPHADTPIRRQFEAEKMEWNDIVELSTGTSLDQVDVLEWVETDLADQGITYDYMILQDINTFVQLDIIKQELDSGVISDSLDSPFSINPDAPTNLVWGNFRGDAGDKDAVVVGASAVKLALQHRKEIEAASNKGEPILTSMYKYYQAYTDTTEADNDDTAADDNNVAEQEALERGQLIPEFIREDGPEGSHRFIQWENNVESVHPEDIAVTRVYQDLEFSELSLWTRLKPVPVCHRAQSTSGGPTRPLDDDEEVTALLEEEHTDLDLATNNNNNDNDKASSMAVVTSSFIYDACMEPSATRAAMNKRDYALKHGYSFVARSAEFAQESARGQRKTVWGKIDVVEKVLPKYEWIFWLDMDAVVMNQDRQLEDILDQCRQAYPDGPEAFDDQVDFVVSRPTRDPMINAGVFLMRNTPWAMQFLRDVQKTTFWFNKGPSYEQGAMWDIMRLPENKQKVFLLDRDDHTFNTFPKFYNSGDFVVHFAPDKCPNDATIKGLNAADKILTGGAVTKLDL